LAYQSRSGPPQHWLEPDVGDWIESCRSSSHVLLSTSDVVVVPIGFLSDHMEVVYDLDCELRERCDRLDINMIRASTVGIHPRFVQMIRELFEERMTEKPQRLALGKMGAAADTCPADCCQYPH
jgi:ferrochelatase